jgi:tRNA-dihydrouridine synthase B
VKVVIEPKIKSLASPKASDTLFYVGNLPIHGRAVLSPMAGVSDSPHRLLARSKGSAWSFTEFVAAEQINLGNPKAIRLFHHEPDEDPVWFQIFGNSVESITSAAQRIEPLNPKIIDLNMGCSVQRVSQGGSGAGLLKNLPLAGRMIESLCKNISVPVTAKIRIGWYNDSLNYRETIHVLQESGVSAISVHGRTKEMAYTGFANWDVIAEIKSFAKVPIFGNGDIDSVSMMQKRLRESKVDAVLIGRAAIGNPWIFAGIEKTSLSILEINEVAWSHYLAMKNFYDRDAFILFKKYFTKYFHDFEDYKKDKDAILRIRNEIEFEETWLSSLERYTRNFNLYLIQQKRPA